MMAIEATVIGSADMELNHNAGAAILAARDDGLVSVALQINYIVKNAHRLFHINEIKAS
jgi:hypothetical protein